MTDETMLLRQVNPSFVEAGETSSQAFYPFPKDEGKLSVDDGGLTTPEAAHVFFTTVLKLESAGTWGVTGAEVAASGLAYVPDPLPENAAHSVIDFSERSEKECRKLARKLKAHANARKRLHPAE